WGGMRLCDEGGRGGAGGSTVSMGRAAGAAGTVTTASTASTLPPREEGGMGLHVLWLQATVVPYCRRLRFHALLTVVADCSMCYWWLRVAPVCSTCWCRGMRWCAVC